MRTLGINSLLFISSTYRYLFFVVNIFGASSQQYSYYAAVNSSSLALNCTSEGLNGELIWKSYTPGTTNDQILVLCNLPSSCTNHNPKDYTSAVYPPVYSLGISELNVNTSTKYACTDLPSGGTQTSTLYYVITLERLTCPQSGSLVAEGTSILMTCTSVYYQYTVDTDRVVRPILTWINDKGSNLNGAEITNLTDTQTAYSVNMTMTAEYDEAPFSCKLAFPSSTGLTYTDNCQVSYQMARGVTLVNPGLDASGGVPTVTVGDVINCTANGKPYPTIKWVDTSGIQLSSSSSLEISDELSLNSQPVTCSCIAYNFINGVDYEVFSNVTFYVQKSSAVVQSSSAGGWVIAMSICIPLAVLLCSAILAIWFHRRHKAEKAKQARNRNTISYTAVNTSPYPNTTVIPFKNVSCAPSYHSNNGSNSLEFGVQIPVGGFGDLGAEYYQGTTSALNSTAESYIPITGPAYEYNPRQVQETAAKQSANPSESQQDSHPNQNTRPKPVPPSYPITGPSRQASGSSTMPPSSDPSSRQDSANTTLTVRYESTPNHGSPALVPPVPSQVLVQNDSDG